MENDTSLSTELPPITQKEIDMEFRFIMKFIEAGYLNGQDILNDYFWKTHQPPSTR